MPLPCKMDILADTTLWKAFTEIQDYTYYSRGPILLAMASLEGTASTGKANRL